MITALIFDLDGLLADTERLHCKAYQDSLSQWGFYVSEDDYSEHWIRRGGSIGEFIDSRGCKIDPEVIRVTKAKRYNELVKAEAKPMPGALALLDRLKEKKLALATSSYREAAYAVIRALNIETYFSCIATRGDVVRIKPYPDLFLFAARVLGEAPRNCLVFEDSEKGIAAAHAAGMASIAVPNVHTLDHDFSKATMVVQSLEEITEELLGAQVFNGDRL